MWSLLRECQLWVVVTSRDFTALHFVLCIPWTCKLLLTFVWTAESVPYIYTPSCWYSLEYLRWVPMCQGFSHFAEFLHYFVSTKWTSRSIGDNLSNVKATFVQSTRMQRYLWEIKAQWYWYSSDQYLMPGFQSFFSVFASFCNGQISHHQHTGWKAFPQSFPRLFALFHFYQISQ